LHRTNWLGVALMRSEQKRFLLGECVQAYLPLDAEQQREFQRLVATEHYKGVQAMNMTSFEKGRLATIHELLEEKFGPLPPQVVERLERLPPESLIALGRALLRANSLRELDLED
jgi:Domain of unknown function (DUF4351)